MSLRLDTAPLNDDRNPANDRIDVTRSDEGSVHCAHTTAINGANEIERVRSSVPARHMRHRAGNPGAWNKQTRQAVRI